MATALANVRESSPLAAANEVLHPYLQAVDQKHALVAAKCVGLMAGYSARWANSPYWIDDVECTVTGTLVNPETGARSRTFGLAGKIDIRAREIATNARVIFDHKTCSQEIADPNASYWRQLAVEGQVNHYMLIEWELGNKVDYALWDVVRKPTISPKLLSKKDRENVLMFGSYSGVTLTPDQLEEFAEGERETSTMYAARVAQDCTLERPETYFQRRQIPRLDSEIHEYAMELWGHSQDLILARRLGRHPRNSGACMNYGKPCKFLGICSGHDAPDSDQWTKKTSVHPELPTLEGDGKDLLTNSRIRCFQSCRQKHHFQYELGIERLDEEERESLWFGDLFHRALEQFFLELKRQQKGATQ